MSDEVKVVISLKGEKVSVGVQSPECDPLFAVVEGGLNQALERVPALLEEARTRWAESPRYAECDKPLPSQTQPAPSQRQPTRQSPQMSML